MAMGARRIDVSHGMMDGAGIVPLPAGGYVYVSNSEKPYSKPVMEHMWTTRRWALL